MKKLFLVFISIAAFVGAMARAGTTLPQLTPRPISCEVIDLAGTWRFNGSANIVVPGEWVMQGFDVNPGQPALYEREFTVPAGWTGQRVKLRCDAVFSDATVFINGTQAGKHLGGFTPFELDVTVLVKPGQPNIIKLAVISESLADTEASASKYACHPLGGISRGIRLFALPEVNVSSLCVVTKFDKNFRDATLELDIEATGDAMEVLTLTAPNGKDVPLVPNRIAPGHVSIPVSNPVKWDNEHPNLYTLTVKLEHVGKVVETVTQRVGFRQVEVRGNQLFVNGMPVKLRGICRHEVYPLTGRSVPSGLHRRDVELFRNANVNLIRTSHYPPDEALLEAADELGMFIECEAPFCWANDISEKEHFNVTPASIDMTRQETAEMVLAYRNHPSILWWSAANESRWGVNFEASTKLIRELDPTRPVSFSYPTSQNRFGHELDISNVHYAGHSDPIHARRGYSKPIFQEEECHLNAYNRLELATDPGLRDQWGKYLREMWDDQYNSLGSLGQAIWAGIDDTFYIKDDLTVGYGTWGPIDGWRREKPEYWNMKKAYSPVRLGKPTVSGNTVAISVENRQHFANLNEMKIAWKLGSQSGTTTTDAPPAGKSALSIALNVAPQSGDRLELIFTDPRGFVADEFSIALGGTVGTPHRTNDSVPRPTVDKRTGRITAPFTGPELMLLPLNNDGETQMTGKTKVWTSFTAPCSGWKCDNIFGEGDRITVQGQYDNAKGAYTYTFKPGGVVEIAYEFTATKKIDPRQIGLVFTLPHDCEVFTWERTGYWDVYPDDHIARPNGTVKASEGFPATSVGPRIKPSHPWRLDNLPYGNNDFCSTKHNVLHATVLDVAGRGLVIDGQGKQHVRCWRTGDAVHVLVADYSSGG